MEDIARDLKTDHEKILEIIRKVSNVQLSIDKLEAIIGMSPQGTRQGFMGLFYGNHGGPFSNSNADPIDCLDLACYMHDRYLHRKYFQELARLILNCYAETMSLGAKEYIEDILSTKFTITEWLYMNTIDKVSSCLSYLFKK